MVAYAPTLEAVSEEKEKFYSDLRHAVEAVPVHNFLSILGDFNARLGQEDAAFTYHQGKTNDKGVRLLELMEDYSLLATNTMFEKRRGRL